MRADLLGALVLDHVLGSDAHLVVVGRRERVLEPVQRLVHLARRGEREEVEHVLLELDRHRRDVLRRADVADHGEDLVLVDQLLRRQHGLLRVVAVSSTISLSLRPLMPPCSLISSTRMQHAVAHLLAEAGERAGQVLDRADDDLVLGHALRLRQRLAARRAKSRRAPRSESRLHRFSSVVHGSLGVWHAIPLAPLIAYIASI